MYDYRIFKTAVGYTVIIFQHGQYRNRTIVRQIGFIAEWQAKDFAEKEIAILTGN